MPNESNKKQILFIASNIPTPKRKSNKVVITIAHQLSQWFDISVMHPAEFAPFPISLMKKYKDIAGKNSWSDGTIQIRPLKYIRLFGRKHSFLLLPYVKKRLNHYLNPNGIPDLVHAHYALPDGYLAYMINQIHHTPYIISFRDSDIKFLTDPRKSYNANMMDKVLSNAKKIIVHNGAHQELLSKAGYDSIIMAHGVEKDFLRPKETVNTSNNIVISTVSELIPRKHIDWIINAVEEYKGSKNITLKIAGRGALRIDLESLSRGHENIQFLGQIDHGKVDELLQQSDIFALPSVNETFGLVYLEATAHQNAVIATKGTGVWGHFIDGDEMFYCDSYSSFKEMLFRLIDDNGLRNQMALNAFIKTKDNYSWNTIISKYVSLYEAFLTEHNS